MGNKISKLAKEFLKLKKQTGDKKTTFADFLDSESKYTCTFIYLVNDCKRNVLSFMDLYKDKSGNLFAVSPFFYYDLKLYQTVTHEKGKFVKPSFLLNIKEYSNYLKTL